MKKKLVLTVLFLFSIIYSTQASKMNIYGFMDMTIIKPVLDSPTILSNYGYGDGLTIKQGNVNLYFDWAVNKKIRTLIETNLNVDPSRNNQHYTQYYHYVAPGIGEVGADTSNASNHNINNKVADNQSITTSTWLGISLERAWFDLLFNQYINVKIGKFITPAGIWKVDHGSPIIIPVQQPYEVSTSHIFPNSQTGLMEYGTYFLGDFDINYKLYTSIGQKQNYYNNYDLTKLTDLAGGGNLSINLPILDEAKIGFSGYKGKEISTDKTLDVYIQMDPSTMYQTPDYTKEFDYASSTKKISYDGILDLGTDLKLSLKNITFQGEFNSQFRTDYLNQDLNGDYLESKYYAFYTLLAYKIPINNNLSISPYGLYEKVFQDVTQYQNMIDDPNASLYQKRLRPNNGAIPVGTEGYKVFLGGLNIGIFSNAVIKLEYSYIVPKGYEYTGEPPTPSDVITIKNFKTQFSVAF